MGTIMHACPPPARPPSCTVCTILYTSGTNTGTCVFHTRARAHTCTRTHARARTHTHTHAHVHTGDPKGVIISHRALVGTIAGAKAYLHQVRFEVQAQTWSQNVFDLDEDGLEYLPCLSHATILLTAPPADEGLFFQEVNRHINRMRTHVC